MTFKEFLKAPIIRFIMLMVILMFGVVASDSILKHTPTERALKSFVVTNHQHFESEDGYKFMYNEPDITLYYNVRVCISGDYKSYRCIFSVKEETFFKRNKDFIIHIKEREQEGKSTKTDNFIIKLLVERYKTEKKLDENGH